MFFRDIRNSETFLHSLGITEIRKRLCTLSGFPKFGKIEITGETINLSTANLCFRVKTEFLLSNFSSILSFRENNENSILYK